MSNLVVCLMFVSGWQASEERPRHPLAPSIPLLTKEEEKRIERAIERLILYDIGKLKGAEGKKAVDDFNRLGPEAIFHLIEGFNNAANMESSCPCVLIAKKISQILFTSEDVGLLSFAKDNIGTGVTVGRHMSVVKDLKLQATLRRTAVSRLPGKALPPATTRSPLVKNSIEELDEIIQNQGKQKKQAVEELGRRKEARVIDVLARAAQSDAELTALARSTLEAWLARQTAKDAAGYLQHPTPLVRELAAHAAGNRGWPIAKELIELLADNETAVAQAARQALVRLSRGIDHGPAPDAGGAEREEAMQRWRQWWMKK